MKHQLIIILSLLVLIASCTQVDETEKIKTELSNKKAKHEATRKQLSDLRNEIEVLESELAERLGTKVETGKLVTAFEVQKSNFKHFIEVQGTAQSEKNISISTDIGGLVTDIHVDEGDKVNQGQILIQLDNSLILNNIEEIQTSLDLAETVYKKQKALWEQNIGSEIQYLQAKNNKETLERRLQTTYTQLEKTRIKTPISGTVDEVYLKPGEMASPGAPAVRVVNVDRIEIQASVPESYLGDVKRGEDVTVHFPALDINKDAIVKSVGQVINPNNRTFDILVNLDNKDNLLKPNLLAVIRILDYSNDSVITIPNRLVHFGRDSKFVYAVESKNDEKYAVKKVVEIGVSYEGMVEVVSGLESGDILIDEGYRDVTQGELISIASKSQVSSDGTREID